MKFYKWHGAGNDFVIVDARKEGVRADAAWVSRLCDRHTGIGGDGLMVLGAPEDGHDFRMEYYNSDGSGGMMCGNGGRCIVAFAMRRGVEPSANLDGTFHYRFIAPDGPHEAYCTEIREGLYRVRLGMKDVANVDCRADGSFFLDTGTRHLVKFVTDLGSCDVEGEGAVLRHDAAFAPQGTNVNFVESEEGGITVRTFEKGVEAETLACGTGVVASAMASFLHGTEPSSSQDGRLSYAVRTRRGDMLGVDFRVESGFADVWLTGPAEYVFTTEL